MLRMLRWRVCCLAVGALCLASAVVLHGQSDTWIIHYNVPQQRVQIADDRGRLRMWRFEANAHIWEDGRARGTALLERGGEDYELEYQSATWVFNEAGSVASVTFVGEGVRTSGNRDPGFGFVEMVSQEEGGTSTPDTLIFLGPDVHGVMRFEVTASITAR